MASWQFIGKERGWRPRRIPPPAPFSALVVFMVGECTLLIFSSSPLSCLFTFSSASKVKLKVKGDVTYFAIFFFAGLISVFWNQKSFQSSEIHSGCSPSGSGGLTLLPPTSSKFHPEVSEVWMTCQKFDWLFVCWLLVQCIILTIDFKVLSDKQNNSRWFLSTFWFGFQLI